MQALTREEVVQRRKYFLTRAQNTAVVSKGSKRVGGTRICAICQTPLSRVILTTGAGLKMDDFCNRVWPKLLLIEYRISLVWLVEAL